MCKKWANIGPYNGHILSVEMPPTQIAVGGELLYQICLPADLTRIDSVLFSRFFQRIGAIEMIGYKGLCDGWCYWWWEPGEDHRPAVIPLKFWSATDPWMFFIYALTALAYKDKHIQRLLKFLDFLGYMGTNDDRARAFVTKARTEPNYAFNSVLKFFQRKREQIDRKQIA